ncbi:hypothetical protein HPB48_012419 [Haemaphysalis longicornis]|uniref:Uncharacterized protein n=1 Tax=Haemaphysalis longicornis TaxID=44386 RepID=A0A9J6FRB6_HAELO|nr:hypothetical protein HPB48_012419 [Haemaphysalis longicornis]
MCRPLSPRGGEDHAQSTSVQFFPNNQSILFFLIFLQYKDNIFWVSKLAAPYTSVENHCAAACIRESAGFHFWQPADFPPVWRVKRSEGERVGLDSLLLFPSSSFVPLLLESARLRSVQTRARARLEGRGPTALGRRRAPDAQSLLSRPAPAMRPLPAPVFGVWCICATLSLWDAAIAHNGLKLRFACMMDLYRFPMDSQVCSIELASWEYSCLKADFHLQRSLGYHMVQSYLPTVLIVVISWVSFWLDVESIPARTTLGVTTLLTISSKGSGIQSNLPPVSYVKAIDVWMGACTGFVFSALLEFTVVSCLARIQARDKESNLVTTKHGVAVVNAVAENQVLLQCTVRAKTIDQVCRVAFPAIFLVFNAIYWPYFMCFTE